MPTFKNNTILPLSNDGESIQIISFISEGGQGEVYKVRYRGDIYALKWYSKLSPSRKFYDNLIHNIDNRSPSDYFLWPKAVTKVLNGRFGYVMDIKPDGFEDYSDYLLGDVRPYSWDILFKAALNIADAFFILHSKGYSYQDLNEGSFFINPKNGDIRICDNDNVAPYGTNLGVRGTPRYMAPEVVLDKTRPNVHTDRFSLAIILFRMFYIDHPLEGKRTISYPLNDTTGAELYGRNPIFAYDPNNTQNRPTEQAQPNLIMRWKLFPVDLKAAFTKAFTKGLKNINDRITEQQWKEVLVKARGMLVNIDGKEQFVNAYCPKTVNNKCRILKTSECVIALTPGSVLYQCQVDRLSTDYSTVAAVVKASNRNEKVYGLGNLTQNKWSVTLPGRNPVVVQPKTFAPLIPGAVIDFGNINAEVY